MKQRIRDAWSVLKGEKVAVPKAMSWNTRTYWTTTSNATTPIYTTWKQSS